MVALWSVTAFAAVVPVGNAEATDSTCLNVPGRTSVASPTRSTAWRAGLQGRAAVFYRLPGKRRVPSRWLAREEAPEVLVLGRPRASDHRCWLRVRLPWRPNGAAGWIDADNVILERTPWRIEVSRASRTLTLFRAGARVRTVRVVIGKPSTPTPVGTFAVTWAIQWHPDAFLGSWVLELTGHSDALQHFDGGDGTVGIHGRGGASLIDPLGSARSHGCIRLANDAIDWLVRTIGASQLPGTPVHIS